MTAAADGVPLWQLRQAVDASGEVIFLTDRNGTITFVNHEFERLYGYSAAEVVGRTTPRILNGGINSPEYYASFWTQLLAGHIVRGEFQNRARDGRLIHVETSANPVLDDQGRIVGFLAVQRDATARRQAEAALRASEHLYRTLAEAAHDAIFVVDRDMRIAYINNHGAATLHRQPEQVVGRPLDDLFPPDVVPALRQNLAEAFDAQSPIHCEEHVVFPGGGRWLSTWLVPITDDAGAATRVMGISRDITDRHRLAEQLERQNGLLSAVIESAPNGVCVLRAPEFTIELANAAMQRLAPRCGEPIPFAEAWPDAVAEVLPILQRVLSAGRSEHRSDVEIVRSPAPDGHRSPGFVTVHACPIHFPHQALDRVLLIVEDTTDRKELLAQFHQAQKMEAVGRLAGGIAHDFNNLLTSIIGFSELLAGTLGAQDGRRADLQQIHTAATSAAALTRQLLTFSRRQQPEPTIVDLNTVIARLEVILRRTLRENIAVELRLDPALGPIAADPGQLEQLLMNLAVNAGDAMLGGGHLIIGTANVTLDRHERAHKRWVPPGDYVEWTVADDGVGMFPEVRAHLFEPFFTTKPVGQGTGLGLSTAYGIITASHGYVAVDSEPGRGTTFTVYFPRVPVGPTARWNPGAARRATGHETILVVEDNDAVRELVRRGLVESGYTVLLARDGSEAVAISAQHAGSLDLLVTDVVMPGMDGVQGARAVRARHPEAAVLYMSGYPDDVLARHGVAESDTVWLSKPFDPAALTQAVRQALNTRLSAKPVKR